MSTKTPHFCEKMAEKYEVKHDYPHFLKSIIWGHPVNSSSACNSMKFQSIIPLWFLLNFVIDFVYWYNIALVILFFLICDQNFIKGRGLICRVTSDNAIFSRGGSHVWPQFSQLFFNKIGEFLCSLERKFPEFSKTLPTFVLSKILVPSMALKQGSPFFWDTL